MKKTLLLLLLAASTASAQQVAQLTGQDKNLPGKPSVVYSIGEEDGEDWEMLSRVSQVTFDKDDNLYILDAGNHRVLVFDARGKFVRKIGKKGGGPGELMTPVGLAVTTSNEIAVTDIGRPAISLFRKDGTFIKNLPLGDEFGFPVPTNGTFAHPHGGVAVRTMPPVVRGAGEMPSSGTITNRKSPVTWFTSDKQTRLFDIPQPDITPKITDSSPGSNNRRVAVRVISPAFLPATLWGILPNGTLALSTEQDYRIQLIQNGKVTRVLERPFKARKVTEADKAKEKERRREQMQRGSGAVVSMTQTRGSGGEQRSINVGGMPRGDVDAMIKDMTFNDYMPVLAGLYADPRGRLWVQRTGRQVGQDGPIDLISANGQYLGTVVGQKLPAAVSVSGRAAYIERDEMDVERVVVRKLPQGW